MAIFRAVHAAIQKDEGHVQAKRIIATLTYFDSAMTLEARGGGSGFQTPQQLRYRQRLYGLIGICERIFGLSGQILNEQVSAGYLCYY